MSLCVSPDSFKGCISFSALSARTTSCPSGAAPTSPQRTCPYRSPTAQRSPLSLFPRSSCSDISAEYRVIIHNNPHTTTTEITRSTEQYRKNKNKRKAYITQNYKIMHQRRNSKTSIKLPKLISTPVKSPERSLRKSVKLQQNPAKLTAQAYGLYSMDMTPLVQFNTTVRREIASLTKMMTLLVTVRLCEKYKINMNKCYFRVTTNAAGTRGTTAELEARQWATVEDLLHGLMLPSGNDAAAVLAENLGACVYYERLGEARLLVDLKSLDLTEDTFNIKIYTEQFVKIMNSTAKDIGMRDTCYVNPHGLDCSYRLQAYSNVEDQALLVKALVENGQCSKIISKPLHTCQLKTICSKDVEIRRLTWQNTNVLLAEEGFIGGKTGQTQYAGNCLASVYQSKSKGRFVLVLLGCGSKELRFSETRTLVERYIMGRVN